MMRALNVLGLVGLLGLNGCATVHAASVDPKLPATAQADGGAPVGMVPMGDFSEAGITEAWEKFDARVAAGDRVVWFRIDSFGGMIYPGLDLMQHVDEWRAMGGRTVCVVDTHAMSMGAVFLEGACDERYMTARATLLFHNASVDGAGGNARELEETAGRLRAISRALALVCSNRMGMALDVYLARVEAGDWMMAADEAVALGAADGLVDPLTLPPVL